MFSFKLKPKKLKDQEIKKAVVANPKILEINLIKEEVGVSFNFAKNLSTLFFVFFIAAIVLGEIYFGLDWWQDQEIAKTEATQTEISKLNREISVLNNQANDAIKYKTKALALSGLLNNHIYWSNFLTWLEKNTLSTVQYSDLSGDLSGIYSFNATAKTYADVSWQTKAFLNDPLTKSASVELASLKTTKDKGGTSQINFNLNLEVDPAIFNK